MKQNTPYGVQRWSFPLKISSVISYLGGAIGSELELPAKGGSDSHSSMSGPCSSSCMLWAFWLVDPSSCALVTPSVVTFVRLCLILIEENVGVVCKKYFVNAYNKNIRNLEELKDEDR